MREQAIPPLSFAVRSYYLLTKPGIIMGNAVTALGGVALALNGPFPLYRFLAMLLGLSFVIASACVFNNCIDKESDRKMARTKNRPLVLGIISLRAALIFAASIGAFGGLILYFWVNPLSSWLAISGFVIYVILYSFSKYHSVYCTLIGSVAGAIPPVVGYCAISGKFDFTAGVLFTMLALWQMPHFYAIAIFRMEEYTNAGIPVLPKTKGLKRTKIEMLIFLLSFIAVALFLSNAAGIVYLCVTAALNIYWLSICLQGFWAKNEIAWARKMFGTSLIVIMGMSLCLVARIFTG